MPKKKPKERDMAELESSVRKRVGYEERAFRTVERLVESTVTEDQLKDMVCLFTPDHYSDVVDERAISLQCGYPICSNRIQIVKQKYHISQNHSKVYDITQRKKFCSNECFKASDFLLDRVPSSPVWMREHDDMEIVLAPRHHIGGMVGAVVVESPVKYVKSELDSINRQSPATPCSSNTSRMSTQRDPQSASEVTVAGMLDKLVEMKIIDNVMDKHPKPNAGTLSDTTQHVDIVDKNSSGNRTDFVDSNKVKMSSQICVTSQSSSGHDSAVNTTSDTCSKGDLLLNLPDYRDQLESIKVGTTSKEGSSPSASAVTPTKSLIMDISEGHSVGDNVVSDAKHVTVTKRSVMENIERLATMSAEQPKKSCTQLDLIERRLLEWKTDSTVSFLCDSQDETSVMTDFDKKYANLGSKLGPLDAFIEQDSDDDDDDTKPAGKLPNYKSLHEKTDLYNLQVHEFYKGSMEMPTESEKKDAEVEASAEDDSERTWIAVMPLVDSRQQKSIQLKIVLDKLNTALPYLLGLLKLTIVDVSDDLRGLIHTFALTSKNIVLKPAEWSLMAIVLLYILCKKSHTLRCAFKEEATLSVYINILKSCDINIDHIENIVHKVISK